MLKMCGFLIFFLLQSDLAFIVSFCCLYCLYSSIIIIKKKKKESKKNWGSHWNMVLIIIESYGLKNPFHLTSEVPVSSTELWLPVTRNKSIEGTSYQFINVTYDYLESSLVWFNFANSPRRDVKLGMSAGKIKKVSNIETLWWPKVLFHVVFADRGAIRNFLQFSLFCQCCIYKCFCREMANYFHLY